MYISRLSILKLGKYDLSSMSVSDVKVRDVIYANNLTHDIDWIIELTKPFAIFNKIVPLTRNKDDDSDESDKEIKVAEDVTIKENKV